MQISDSSSRILAGLLEARTGQQLTMSRRWRIETALSSLLRERGIATLDELITILVMGREPSLSQQVVEAFESELGIRAGETTPDGEITLRSVECLGGCGYATVVAVDDRYRQHVRAETVPEILGELDGGT